MDKYETIMLPYGKINVGSRHRQDMGDIKGLAESIREVGLLQPIGLTADRRLVFGERRLRAMVDVLEWEEIPCRIVDIDSITNGEYHENEMRKDFTPSERVAIADAVKEGLSNRRGSNQYQKKEDVANCPQAEAGEKSREIAAQRAGFSSEQEYRRAKAVVESGDKELIEKMDKGEVAISRAAATVKTKNSFESPQKKKAESHSTKRGSYDNSDEIMDALNDAQKNIKSVIGMLPKKQWLGKTIAKANELKQMVERLIKQLEEGL